MDTTVHGDAGDTGPEFWVNLASGEVEQGRQSPAMDRMGPYPTREAAQHAFDAAALRTRRWDEDDRRWNDDAWPEGAGGTAP